MNQLLERLRKMFQIEEARNVYADSIVNVFISAQIKHLREARGLTQEELAGLIGTKQSGISRLEKADYSAWKVETLRKLAHAFRVRLRISFEEFGTIPDDLQRFDTKDLVPRKFEDDPVFFPAETADRETNAENAARGTVVSTALANPSALAGAFGTSSQLPWPINATAFSAPFPDISPGAQPIRNGIPDVNAINQNVFLEQINARQARHVQA